MGAAIPAIPPRSTTCLPRHGLACTGLPPGRRSAQSAAARSSSTPGRSGNAALMVRFRAPGNEQPFNLVFVPCQGRRADMTFIQLIETTTTRRDEMDALAERWRSLTKGRRTARRSTATHDQDRPDTYILIVEFSTYDDAMANSALPETADFRAPSYVTARRYSATSTSNASMSCQPTHE